MLIDDECEYGRAIAAKAAYRACDRAKGTFVMIDEIFRYKVKANSFPAHCRVRISSNTVVATELLDNEGMSITNAAEEVAMQVCQFYEIPIAQLTWKSALPKKGRHR